MNFAGILWKNEFLITEGDGELLCVLTFGNFVRRGGLVLGPQLEHVLDPGGPGCGAVARLLLLLPSRIFFHFPHFSEKKKIKGRLPADFPIMLPPTFAFGRFSAC